MIQSKNKILKIMKTVAIEMKQVTLKFAFSSWDNFCV